MLRDSKVRRYLLYAGGEILLVVVGILIAIWLNNLNQNRLAQTDLNKKVTKLRQEIYRDSLHLEFISESNRTEISRINQAINLLKPDITYLDYVSFLNIFSDIANRSKSYAPHSQTYLGLLNSGEFSAIQNQDLKDRIAFLYFYYGHMATLNYNSIDQIQRSYNQLFDRGILTGRYFNQQAIANATRDGWSQFQNTLRDPDKRRIIENYLFQEIHLSQLIIRRNDQMMDALEGLPLPTVETQ